MPVDPSADLISEVRFLVGDVTEPYMLTDAQVQFALDQASDATYAAAAACARALAARFTRDVDERFEEIWSDSSQKSIAFERLARRLEADAKKRGGLGTPSAGGISKADMEAAESDTDRVKPFFRRNLFVNPPAPNE